GNGDDILARMDEELVHFTKQLRSAEARAAFEAFMSRKG
ncbi:MAG TPA: enoyl-CoA hydratase, partial [Pseudorhizobium sp.]|nr:enoyl-CoA hydratase [Pseudorhizobium sp.]